MNKAAETRADVPSRIATSLLTFLIADVRGYTHFTLERGDEAAAELAGAFAAIAKEVARARGGEVIELRGDEALAVFASAREALHAALDLQERFAAALAADPSLPLRVGIGLDAGEAVPVEGGYRGGALNLAARLCSIAGAGEVFCSETVVGLARKTEGIAFIDRGEVSLKGLTDPVRVIQIAPEDEVPEELPPLQAILVTHPNNLPDEPTPFIGREREIAQVVGLLRDPHIRLVTLTGPGGTGKTRLALQVGSALLHDFPDGVFFVNLAPLADPALVPSAAAKVLGVKEEPDRDLVETLAGYLKSRHILLVLDNFEHLLDASTAVASLLDACPELNTLITSRSPLHLSREQEYLVPSLSVPDPTDHPDPRRLSQYEAVALFIQRAKAVKPDFAVTDDNAPAVAEICSRLDGLPLAIELAAARIKLFPPQALLQRLANSLQLLTGGARDRPSRQQTLRRTIDWSYSLLSEEEQTLFAHLSVFVGGCSLEAAEAVCNADGKFDLLEGMASLVDKSLLREEGKDEPRFGMLETIRAYAAEKLAEQGDGEAVRGLQADFYLDRAEHAEAEMMRGMEPTGPLDWPDQERDNLRSVLRWQLGAGREEGTLTLAAALFPYWNAHGYWREGRNWLEQALQAAARAAPDVRAKALLAVGIIAGSRQGDYAVAMDRLNEALTLFRRLGYAWPIAMTLSALAITAREQGDERWREYFSDALAGAQEIKGGVLRIMLLHNLGITAYAAGEVEQAEVLIGESFELAQQSGHAFYVSGELSLLAHHALDHAEYQRAQSLAREALELGFSKRYMLPIMSCLDVLAGIAASKGEAGRTARLLGALETVQQTSGGTLFLSVLRWRQSLLDTVRAQIGDEGWDRAWNEGRAMSLDQAVAYALEKSGEEL